MISRENFDKTWNEVEGADRASDLWIDWCWSQSPIDRMDKESSDGRVRIIDFACKWKELKECTLRTCFLDSC